MVNKNLKQKTLLHDDKGKYMALLIDDYKHLKGSKFIIIGRRIIVTKQFLVKFHEFLKRSNDKRFMVLYHLCNDFLLYNRILNDLVPYNLSIELCDSFNPSEKMISDSIKYRLLNKTGLVKSVSQFSQTNLNLL